MIWLTSAAARPSRTRKAADSRRTGTPRAAATSGSTEANSSGRRHGGEGDESAGGDDQQRDHLPDVMPRKLPNSSALAPLRKPPYSVTNR